MAERLGYIRESFRLRIGRIYPKSEVAPTGGKAQVDVRT